MILDYTGQDYKGEGYISFEFVFLRDYGCFNEIWVGEQSLLDGCGGESVACSVDDVVEPGHDIEIAIFIEEACVSGDIVAGRLAHILVHEGLIVPIESGHKGGRERLLHANSSQTVALFYLFILLVQNLDVEARHRLRAAPRLAREPVQILEVATHYPSRLSLPIVVVHLHSL